MKEKITRLLAIPFPLMLFGTYGCACSETQISGDSVAEGIDSISDSSGDDPGSSTDAFWDAPIDNLGDRGWRDSTEPWCEDRTGSMWAYDVWSNESGVYALVSIEIDHGSTGETSNTLYFNDGTGWTRPLDEVPPMHCMMNFLTGFQYDELIGWGHYCPVTQITGGSIEYLDFSVWDLHVISEAYAVGALLGDPRLVQFSGDSWGPYPGEPLPYQVQRVWADESVVYCAGESGIILSREDESWLVHATGTMDKINTLWGFSRDDVWAGTNKGKILRFDGVEWDNVEWPDMGDSTDPDSCRLRGEEILEMWGQNGTLFFHTNYQLVMWDGVDLTSLAYWPGELGSDGFCHGGISINAIWGNSPTEVFLAVSQEDNPAGYCEHEVFLLWWDGMEFHWF